ncbi:MAG: FkbM family methyltransferase [Roseibium sp.]|nr:FkbM family methyltransferase [Roseibium sp.]
MPSIALSGVIRSLTIYHRDHARAEAMDRLHAKLLRPGELAFDIGAHVGDRIASFRRVGARVVAVEPQTLPMRALQLMYGRDENVQLVEVACGACDGHLTLIVNEANPTVTTASKAFVEAAADAPGWEGQAWDDVQTVTCVTLDSLIARYGVPDFVKIDVEGFEPDVLSGLSTALKALSFEFTTIQRHLVRTCVERLLALGPYRFNFALGESQVFALDAPVEAADLFAAVEALPDEANSGDVYAWRYAGQASTKPAMSGMPE